MARPRPFLLCRYSLFVGAEPLSARAQYTALSEIQGKYFAANLAAERIGRRDTAIFRVRQMTVEGERTLAWSVGRRIGKRMSVEPDRSGSTLEFKPVDDAGVHYADFAAIPRLGVMAIDDRTGEPHLGGKAAIRRFQACFEHIAGGKSEITLTATNSDVDAAMKGWGLTEFSFIVRPANPHPFGDLSKDLSDEFRKDGIGRERGVLKPPPGEMIKPAEDGRIAAIKELADSGYGQIALKGVTKGGHNAEIKAPKFEESKTKNQQRQTELRELRVVIDAGADSDDAVLRAAIGALRQFYER